jgi:hypothetical protein
VAAIAVRQIARAIACVTDIGGMAERMSRRTPLSVYFCERSADFSYDSARGRPSVN